MSGSSWTMSSEWWWWWWWWCWQWWWQWWCDLSDWWSHCRSCRYGWLAEWQTKESRPAPYVKMIQSRDGVSVRLTLPWMLSSIACTNYKGSDGHWLEIVPRFLWLEIPLNICGVLDRCKHQISRHAREVIIHWWSSLQQGLRDNASNDPVNPWAQQRRFVQTGMKRIPKADPTWAEWRSNNCK